MQFDLLHALEAITSQADVLLNEKRHMIRGSPQTNDMV